MSDADDIDATAWAWVIELDGGPPSRERLAALRAWLRLSSAHRRTFEQAASAWLDMDVLSSLLQREPQRTFETEARSPANPVRSPPRLRWAFSVAVAALLLLTFAAGLTFLRTPAAVRVASYQTATGQVKTVTLPDGSKVQLNTASLVRVAYGRDFRRLQLLSGEAYFEVAANPHRPFLVYTDRFAVRAVGTAFTVQRLDSGVDVAVTQGHVELTSFTQPVTGIARATPNSTEPARDQVEESHLSMAAGQHIVVAHDVKVLEQIGARSIDKRLAWRSGMLLFDDDPLQEVVAQISRYTESHIIITDPSISELKIGGYFRVQDIDLILETLHDNFGIAVTRGADHTIYLAGRRFAR